MADLVLIDAYNAMYKLLRDPPTDRDASRRLLVELALAVLRQGRFGGVDRAHLVFDTWPGAARAGLRGRQGRVSWHYATGSADEAILEHVRRHEGQRRRVRILLVTDDRELSGRARQLGARGMSVAAFFEGGDTSTAPEEPRRRGALGTFTADDFDLPDGTIDLTDPDLL